MNELFLERIKKYFPENYEKYLNALKEPCTRGFFVNTEKGDIDSILNVVDFEYKNSEITDQSFYHFNDNIGKTKAYELGLIYPQEIGASITSRYFDAKNINTIVDMCAAPGGKTINIINRLGNSPLVISNDNSHLRASILSSNIERMGFDNVIVTNKECDVLANELEGFADLVILDAPCSGEGMIRKYPEILDTYNIENINELSGLQSNLLDYAYRICKKDGYILYSTCTYAFEEDEDQIRSFMGRYKDIEIIPFENQYESTLPGTIKMSPIDNTEGQFAVMMKKNSDVDNSVKVKYLKTVKEKLVEDFIKENTDLKEYYLYKHNDNFYISFVPLLDMKRHVLKYGVLLGELKGKRFEPNHHFYRSNYISKHYRYTYDLNDKEYDTYISGNELRTDLGNHYYLVTYKGFALGYGKCSNGQLKNKYPKGLRRVV